MHDATDSTNTNPPFFGPTLPVYPELPQIVKVTGPALDGTSPGVYPCLVQQYVQPLTLRDREPSYVTEPNGVALAVGAYYDCRLVTNYLGLPLYATSCCVIGSPGSSSSAAAPSSAPGPASSPGPAASSGGSSSPGASSSPSSSPSL